MQQQIKANPYKAIILTALPVEYTAVRIYLDNLQEETHRGTVYERGRYTASGQEWEVGIVEIEAGNTSSAFEAERMLNYFRPNVALFVGVAGGIKDVKLGDVVAATKVYGYESGKAERTFKPRPDVGESSYALIQRAKAESRISDWQKRIIDLKSSTMPTALVGPIAAGEKVVAETRSHTYRFIRNNYNDALAVEMEGRGFLKAVHANHPVLALIIRGISDLVNDKEVADAEGWQRIASRHACAFAFQVLAKFPGKDKADLIMGDGEPLPTLRELRKVLNQRFDEPEFVQFCLDYFPEVHNKFSDQMRKDTKINLLLEFCSRLTNRHQELARLLGD